MITQWKQAQEILMQKGEKRFYRAFDYLLHPKEASLKTGAIIVDLRPISRGKTIKNPSGIRFYQQTARSTGCGGGWPC